MTRNSKCATALIATLALGAASGAHAITFGEPDGNEHPHVGTLLFVQNGVGFFSCTGTLISPTVMLTAGHCVEGGGVENSETYVRFTEHALDGIEDYPTTQAWLDAEWIPAADVIPHPQFDDFAAFPSTFDVGLVILSEPVMLPVYGVLPSEGLLQQVKSQKGNKNNWWTAVGYGAQGVINPFASDDYSRYQTTARLVELNSTNTGPGSSAKFTNNPGGGKGGTCFGDSGGPVFYQDTPIIGAIVSFGITPCIGVDYQFRIDTDTALDFIEDNQP
ncbi:MAG: S1 family peptidase [Steroidobacter sp.]